MAGKATIPARVHRRIQRLAAKGHGRRAIAERVGCSLYTVRKALDPGFAAAEAARHRATSTARYQRRKADPAYRAYQAAVSDTDERRARARAIAARRRAKRKNGAEEAISG